MTNQTTDQASEDTTRPASQIRHWPIGRDETGWETGVSVGRAGGKRPDHICITQKANGIASHTVVLNPAQAHEVCASLLSAINQHREWSA